MEKLELSTQTPEESANSAGAELPDLPSLSLLGSVQTVASGNLKQHTNPASPTQPVTAPEVSHEPLVHEVHIETSDAPLETSNPENNLTESTEHPSKES